MVFNTKFLTTGLYLGCSHTISKYPGGPHGHLHKMCMSVWCLTYNLLLSTWPNGLFSGKLLSKTVSLLPNKVLVSSSFSLLFLFTYPLFLVEQIPRSKTMRRVTESKEVGVNVRHQQGWPPAGEVASSIASELRWESQEIGKLRSNLPSYNIYY